MNGNVQNSNTNSDIKNSKPAVSNKESVTRSAEFRCQDYSQHGSKAQDKNNLDKSSSTLTEKYPKIHKSKRTNDVGKRYTGRVDTSRTARKTRSWIKQEKKPASGLTSDEKSVAPTSPHNLMFNSKADRNTFNNNCKDSKSTKTPYKTNWKRSLPNAKDGLCKTIETSGKSNIRTDLEHKTYNNRRNSLSRSAVRESEKFYKKQENSYSKRYLEKINATGKILVNSKLKNENANDSKQVKESMKISSPQTVGINQKLDKKAVHRKDNIDKNVQDIDGAARTRIFKRHEKNPILDTGHGIKTEHLKNKSEHKKLLPVKKPNRDEEQNKNDDIDKHDKCAQDSISSAYNVQTNDIISLDHKAFENIANSSNFNQNGESGETPVKVVTEELNDDFNGAMSSNLSYEPAVPGNPKIDSMKAQELCSDEAASKHVETELITTSVRTSNHEREETKSSLTDTEIQSFSPDVIKYHTNLMTYGYHFDQQYCKPDNNRENEKNSAETAAKIIAVDKTGSSINEDAKYNLMKALIQPPTDVHKLKDKGYNNVNKLFISGRRSESVINCRDEETLNCYTHSLSNGCINGERPRLTCSVKQSEVNDNNLKSNQTLNSRSNSIDLEETLSNTSDCIAMNSKMKGSKYAKKYRHFKHEEKNMCCDISRYIKRMVSNERRYQGFEKSENPEKEEVKIIIDENCPETSKIRIVNNRSSVSVVCHSFGRTQSPGIDKNNAANKAESSGGESSGYKSFHNNLNTEHSQRSKETKTELVKHNENKRLEIMRTHSPEDVLEERHNSLALQQKADTKSSEIMADYFFLENEANQCADEINEDVNSKRYTAIQYTSYDTSNYLSTFTNCMDVYLPCEITAYQFEERKGSKILKLNSKELVEKNVDSAELHIGEYLNPNNSNEKDESSDEGESSEELGFDTDLNTIGDEVIMLKAPNSLKYQSHEFVVNDRLAGTDEVGLTADSTNIPAVPAQYKILDIKPGQMSSEVLINVSDAKLTTNLDEFQSDVKTSTDNLGTNYSDTKFPPVLQMVPKNTRNKKSGNYGSTCLGRMRNENKKSGDPNAVHELWTNKKSTIDSTDTESHHSDKTCHGKSGTKKHDSNKFKFNIFRKVKSSASEKIINQIPLNKLPKPPPPFLASTAPSQSTIFSSSANNDASQSDITTNNKSDASNASIVHTNVIPKSLADITAINNVRKKRQKTISTETINHLKMEPNEENSTETINYSKSQVSEPDSIMTTHHSNLQTSQPAPILPRVTKTQPKPIIAPLLNERLLDREQELDLAVAPPPSALPPPYPFCCPLVPYMMQHWQNSQQPPPSSTVPLPEAEWQSTIGITGSKPPPPGMVPIPWFAPMMHKSHPPTTDEVGTGVANNLHGQALPEWMMMPRDYAPCLPCSRPSEFNRRKFNSSIDEDEEPTLETNQKKQDVKSKKVSNKLFNIFRRKNRADVEARDEDDKKVKYQRSRPEPKLNNVQTAQADRPHVDDHNIWESPDIAGIVTPEEIGRCFRRGFRADGLTLSGDNYLCTKAPSDTTSEQEDIFNFSDHDTPLDFLLALGFSVDEATAAIRDDEVRSRFKAALTEARIWVPHIATTQGTLLYLLAMKAKPKVMRYFLQLVESIVNKRITNAVKLDAYLKILEMVEDGYVSFVTLFGKGTEKDDEEDTIIVEKQRRRIFYTIYKYAETEAEEVGKPLMKASVDLLHSLAARYRSAIGPHLRLLACYIGEGLLTKDVQLEAALIYLSRLDSADVQLADLEKYCGLPPSERRRMEQIERKQISGKNQ